MQPDHDDHITPHFKWGEFASRDYPFSPEALANLPKLCIQLEVLREVMGAPIRVISGYRDPRHNEDVGGAQRSQHLHGRAADIIVKGYAPDLVAVTIERLIIEGRMRQGGLSAYSSFTHYDIRGTRARW